MFYVGLPTRGEICDIAHSRCLYIVSSICEGAVYILTLQNYHTASFLSNTMIPILWHNVLLIDDDLVPYALIVKHQWFYQFKIFLVSKVYEIITNNILVLNH